MDKTEAFKIVFDELQKMNMFKGIYDARNGNTYFMYGIATVMEFVAYSIDDATGDNFSETFYRNMDESEREKEEEEENEEAGWDEFEPGKYHYDEAAANP